MTNLASKPLFEQEKTRADLVLRKIHFKRLKKVDISNEENKFLYDQYLKSNDVRFFNEILWIENEKYTQLATNHFYKNLDSLNKHKFYYDTDLEASLKIEPDIFEVNENDFENKKVCLIGLPFHFILAFKKLRKLNVDVDVVNVSYHSSPKTQFLLNNKASRAFYKLYFGKKRYKEIQIKNKSELKEIDLKKNYEIGFHKLSFIISDKLIKQFKYGLINDHWGALPLFKGRSTLDYSRLFGAELIITNHLIHKEIDSGPILMYSKVDRKNINGSIYYNLGDRILKSIALLCNEKFKDIDNTKGKIFYEMHSFLKNHIKIHKL
ncbi:hypothetical protein KO504_12525 [Winogradskyella psychrotolerans]|uniref:formyltransferase family protein n=1 Tax=Winogradskyella psychrotolerans TaxID=1344585 RepID=UPI001C068644|nr:formyltransferase family protein [Winogradskyella psychrotolerans]MBU2922170.1 hypothetical protein [Winogradskyella psychrotolerans]